MALGEPDWALGHMKVHHCHELLASQTAIRRVCARSLQQAGFETSAELETWMAHNAALLEMVMALLTAVDGRRLFEARELTELLRAALPPVASEAAQLLDLVQGIAGDLSAELASALGRIGPELS